MQLAIHYLMTGGNEAALRETYKCRVLSPEF